jgi:hypothetical protein
MVVAGGDPREGVAHRIRHHRHPLLLGRHLLKKKFKLKLKLKHSFKKNYNCKFLSEFKINGLQTSFSFENQTLTYLTLT